MVNRRQAIGCLMAAAPALRLAGADTTALDIAPGPFKGTRESLKEWQVPAWYRDAKFGIWAHWGPQSAPEYGDWYARNMYIQGNRQYVELLGFKGKVKWTQDDKGLKVQMPEQKPCDHAITLRIV